jgi:twitching motility protein PilT
VNPAVATKIRDGKTHQIASALQTGRRSGMVDFDACLEQLVRDNHITPETAYIHAKDRQRFGR